MSVQVSGCVCFVKNVCLNVLGTSVGHGKRVKQNLRERETETKTERDRVCVRKPLASIMATKRKKVYRNL